MSFFDVIDTLTIRNMEKTSSEEHYLDPVKVLCVCIIQQEVIYFKKEKGCVKIILKGLF